jgi:HK97 family phage prohead protease
MPYYITKESEECAGWAVVTSDMTVMGCHLLKQDAVDQMVAVSQSEGIEPGGELVEMEDAEEALIAIPLIAAKPVKLQAQVWVEAGKGDGKRTISGIAAPYNVEATVTDGQRVRIEPGALPTDGKNPKLFMYHDSTQPVGIVTERVDTTDGMLFSAKIAATAAGDEALTLAKEGVLDSVSVGINPTKWKMEGDVMVVKAAEWIELSLVPVPAFAGAMITDIAASIHQPTPQIGNTEQETPQEETPAMENAPVVEAAAAEATIPTAPIPAQPKREFKLPSAGEFMAAYHIGGDTFKNMNAAVQEYAKSQRTALQAAAGDVLTTDTPGLLPVPVLGPLVQDINFLRPAVNAIGARAYPDGGASKTFIRPTITTHTSVGTQSTELSAASATTMVIASNSVSKTTLAGQVTLSVQDIDFTSPAAMQQILNDLMGEYMIASDNLCADNLLSAATSSGVWDGTLADLLTSIYDAASDISSNRNWMPTHIFVSVDVWAQLGKLADSTGRPVFPFIANGLSGQNALGAGSAATWNGNPLGLELVVDSNFAAKTMVITRVGQGAGDAYEFYEQQRGLMSVEVPATLGRTFSYHGYVSTFAAISGMIRKITQA